MHCLAHVNSSGARAANLKADGRRLCRLSAFAPGVTAWRGRKGYFGQALWGQSVQSRFGQETGLLQPVTGVAAPPGFQAVFSACAAEESAIANGTNRFLTEVKSSSYLSVPESQDEQGPRRFLGASAAV